MMMLETGLDELQAGSYSYRHMTRVSKIWISPQLEPFAKLRNRTLFWKFQMPYGWFFAAAHKNVVEIGFCEVSFFVTVKRITGFRPGKNFLNIKFCTDQLSIHKCAFHSFLTACVARCMTGQIRRGNHRSQL